MMGSQDGSIPGVAGVLEQMALGDVGIGLAWTEERFPGWDSSVRLTTKALTALTVEDNPCPCFRKEVGEACDGFQHDQIPRR